MWSIYMSLTSWIQSEKHEFVAGIMHVTFLISIAILNLNMPFVQSDGLLVFPL
jgi:hypothetical protein